MAWPGGGGLSGAEFARGGDELCNNTGKEAGTNYATTPARCDKIIYMAARKKFSEKELLELPASEVIDRLRHRHYSLLDSLGAKKLRLEMAPAGMICNLFINFLFSATVTKKAQGERARVRAARQKLVQILSWLTPGTYAGMPHDQKQGLVVGFNHPSLGEIARIMLMKIDLMGDKPMYFPVNLPWYETLATNDDRIRRLGIIITPTITPSTWKKLNLEPGSVAYKSAERLKRDFLHVYTDLSQQAMREGGVIFVAPSATRQRTVFKNRATYEKKEEICHTMSMLAIKLYEDPKMDCDFLPMGVRPPEGYKKGFNFFKEYQLIPGKVMTASAIRKKYYKGKHPRKLENFDWDFHKALAETLPKEFWY